MLQKKSTLFSESEYIDYEYHLTILQNTNIKARLVS